MQHYVQPCTLRQRRGSTKPVRSLLAIGLVTAACGLRSSRMDTFLEPPPVRSKGHELLFRQISSAISCTSYIFFVYSFAVKAVASIAIWTTAEDPLRVMGDIVGNWCEAWDYFYFAIFLQRAKSAFESIVISPESETGHLLQGMAALLSFFKRLRIVTAIMLVKGLVVHAARFGVDRILAEKIERVKAPLLRAWKGRVPRLGRRKAAFRHLLSRSDKRQGFARFMTPECFGRQHSPPPFRRATSEQNVATASRQRRGKTVASKPPIYQQFRKLIVPISFTAVTVFMAVMGYAGMLADQSSI
eukprot:TRINITY_DN27710_c1_g1_i1.p1 TRINITY_DN27710_c1_g1~~TRINITY_DN27710_c1_g1_i1.p1  ORF type:complete len:301 (+),score=51.56 TRINITY_DN27710_c1_g1_i1:20-922(+)